MDQHIIDTRRVNESTLQLYRGDLTTQDCEAVVNAANARLIPGGGVDGAIHSAGGDSIRLECAEIGGCPVGQAVVTGAGRLQARYVIHTVGPVWSGENEEYEAGLLASAYSQSLRQAVEHEVRSIAFPSISTGAYGFPITRAARIALRTTRDFLQHSRSIELVRFVLFSDSDLKVYQQALVEVIDNGG